MEPTIDLRSQFPFFDGHRLLVVTAPDHAEAPRDQRGYPFWEIETKTATGEYLGNRGTADNAHPSTIWLETSGILYQTISSTEVGDRTPEIRAWLQKVYVAYHTRLAEKDLGPVDLAFQH